MISFQIQIIAIAEDGRKEVRDITSFTRDELTPETLGLSLDESKAILKDIQQIVVEQQASSFIASQKVCPGCGQSRRSKGSCDLSVRTVFGKVRLQSERLHHCDCQSHSTKTFSPLAELLPERTTPEMLFLETKWSSLMSYDLTTKLLEDTLPLDAPLHASTLREHVCKVAQRLENELGEEQFSFLEGCQRDWSRLPQPDGPLTVGIDGGYVRGRNKEGHFEVIAGKSLLAFRRGEEQDEELSSKCFAYVQTYDNKPK